MKRITLLTFVALLLVGASLGFAAPPAPPEPLVVSLATNISTDPESCTKPSSVMAALHPSPKFMTSGDYCGACSPGPCKNALRGTPCGPPPFNGKRCEYYLNSCSEDGLADCRCYAGPIP
jgi:hypothetical protein